MAEFALAAAFNAVRPDGPLRLDDAALERRLAELVEAAQLRWPTVRLRPVDFVRFVAERATSEAMTPERAADLWIACACALGDAAGMMAFEAAYFIDLGGVLARLRLDATTLDEVAQKIRSELFVRQPGRRPKIAEYGGRGELRGWFRVTAVRSALKLIRGRRREQPFDDEQLLAEVGLTDGGPEAAYIKEVYRPAFKQAFQEAIDSLPAREQNLLRQHFIDGMTVDQLGALHGVHRATAARWVSAAREGLVTRTRERFIQRVRVSRRECDSIMRMLQSQLGTTIRRRLAGAGDP